MLPKTFVVVVVGGPAPKANVAGAAAVGGAELPPKVKVDPGAGDCAGDGVAEPNPPNGDAVPAAGAPKGDGAPRPPNEVGTTGFSAPNPPNGLEARPNPFETDAGAGAPNEKELDEGLGGSTAVLGAE